MTASKGWPAASRTRAAQDRPVGIDERGLCHVLGVVGVAERAQRDPVDLFAVTLVELFERAVRIRTGSTRFHGHEV